MELHKLTYTVQSAAETCDGLSRHSLYKAIGEGRLRAFKHGHRTLIRREDLLEYLGALERWTPGREPAGLQAARSAR